LLVVVYGCESQFLTRGLRVVEKRLLRGIVETEGGLEETTC